MIREPVAFRAAHVDGLGTFTCTEQTILLSSPRAAAGQSYHLPWTGLTVRLAA